MILGNTHSTERSFFFLASFGAASLFALVLSTFLSLLFSALGMTITYSASLWIFLFLFPAALAFSASFIASKLGSVAVPPVVHMIIVGYGVYSLVSLFILLLGGRNEPSLWIILILALISIALFSTETILARLRLSEDLPTVGNSPSRELSAHSPVLSLKITTPSKKEEEGTKPIFLIKTREEDSDARESTKGEVQNGGTPEVINLGPRR